MKTVFISYHAKKRIKERLPNYSPDEVRDLVDIAFNYGADWASEIDEEISDFLMSKDFKSSLENRETKYFAGFIFIYSLSIPGKPALVTLYEYKKQEDYL